MEMWIATMRPINLGLAFVGVLPMTWFDAGQSCTVTLMGTYQAMVHKLLGLNNHRVTLKGVPNISKDLEEIILLAAQDDFFAEYCHKIFGELGEEIQWLLKDNQKQAAQNGWQNLNTIEDMQNFMDKFPELRSRSHTVSKHVSIIGKLVWLLVQVCLLMDVLQFEQELACND